MNHLEQLVSEWLQYNGYFVRTSVPVGPRPNGGYEGELDVVGFCPSKAHLLHVECSLDSLPWKQREDRFSKKFERGRRYIGQVFQGIAIPDTPDQIALLQYASDSPRTLGGARLVNVKQFIAEIFDGLRDTSPASGAVPSNLPLLRTLQLAAHSDHAIRDAAQRLIRHA